MCVVRDLLLVAISYNHHNWISEKYPNLQLHRIQNLQKALIQSLKTKIYYKTPLSKFHKPTDCIQNYHPNASVWPHQ